MKNYVYYVGVLNGEKVEYVTGLCGNGLGECLPGHWAVPLHRRQALNTAEAMNAAGHKAFVILGMKRLNFVNI